MDLGKKRKLKGGLFKEMFAGKEMTQKAKYYTQVNMYKRLLTNMGYNVSNSNDSGQLFNFKVDIGGEGEQKYLRR